MEPSNSLAFSPNVNPRRIQTIYYQGIICAGNQASKYTGGKEVLLPSNLTAVCEGRNQLKPIDVLIEPFIGKEIKDVNPTPFNGMFSYFNPLSVLTASISRISNWYYGINILDEDKQPQEDLAAHALNISEISIGQETDIESHYEKYKLWKENFPQSELILWGVSRGAATTFNAFSRFQYPEVKLVILEGCFYSFGDILNHWFPSKIASWVDSGISFFTKYRNNGPSPASSINNFPEHVPVVFITSEIDKVVPADSTIKLANLLVERGKNEVYLLKLKRSSHPNYMFDDQEDHDNYEALIHAIYKKYGINGFNEILATRGESLLAGTQLSVNTANQLKVM